MNSPEGYSDSIVLYTLARRDENFFPRLMSLMIRFFIGMLCSLPVINNYFCETAQPPERISDREAARRKKKRQSYRARRSNRLADTASANSEADNEETLPTTVDLVLVELPSTEDREIDEKMAEVSLSADRSSPDYTGFQEVVRKKSKGSERVPRVVAAETSKSRTPKKRQSRREPEKPAPLEPFIVENKSGLDFRAAILKKVPEPVVVPQMTTTTSAPPTTLSYDQLFPALPVVKKVATKVVTFDIPSQAPVEVPPMAIPSQAPVEVPAIDLPSQAAAEQPIDLPSSVEQPVFVAPDDSDEHDMEPVVEPDWVIREMNSLRVNQEWQENLAVYRRLSREIGAASRADPTDQRIAKPMPGVLLRNPIGDIMITGRTRMIGVKDHILTFVGCHAHDRTKVYDVWFTDINHDPELSRQYSLMKMLESVGIAPKPVYISRSSVGFEIRAQYLITQPVVGLSLREIVARDGIAKVAFKTFRIVRFLHEIGVFIDAVSVDSFKVDSNGKYILTNFSRAGMLGETPIGSHRRADLNDWMLLVADLASPKKRAPSFSGNLSCLNEISEYIRLLHPEDHPEYKWIHERLFCIPTV
jgi:hypothetical protein